MSAGSQSWLPALRSFPVSTRVKVMTDTLNNVRHAAGQGSTLAGVVTDGAVDETIEVVDGPGSADGYTWIMIDGNLLEIGWVALEFCQDY